MENQIKLPLIRPLDPFQMEMIQKNHLPGLLPSIYTNDNLTADVTGYCALDTFLGSHTLTTKLFKRIIEDLFSLLEDTLLYYLNWNNYCLSAEHIFIALDESTLKFLYIPYQIGQVDDFSGEEKKACPVKDFIYKELLPLCKFSRDEEWSFVLEGITILNSMTYTPNKLDVLYDGFQLRGSIDNARITREEGHESDDKEQKSLANKLRNKKKEKAVYHKFFEKIKKTKVVVDKETIDNQVQGTVLLKDKTIKSTLLPESKKHPQIAISNHALIIGRNTKASDIVIDEGEIGKIHAEVFKKDLQLFVRDLNSLNGTFVNKQRILPYQTIQIEDGDTVTFSTIVYKVMGII